MNLTTSANNICIFAPLPLVSNTQNLVNWPLARSRIQAMDEAPTTYFLQSFMLFRAYIYRENDSITNISELNNTSIHNKALVAHSPSKASANLSALTYMPDA